MVKIDHIIILLTPHHQKSINELFPELFLRSSTLLLHSALIDPDGFKCQKYELKDYAFSRRKVFGSPLKFIKPFRHKIQCIKKEISTLKKNYEFSGNIELYFGSDKDIFTQLFLNEIRGKLTRVVAVDEGLGFYVVLSLKDKLIKLLYSLLTPILFGHRLYYIKRLGTLHYIDTVYLRQLELLPKKVKGVTYKEYRPKGSQTPRPIKKGKVLFFSYPEQDFMLDPMKKVQRHVQLMDYLEKKDRRLIIKPHPRENVVFLKENLKEDDDLKILEAKQLGETLDYFEYELIINVFSSVILDIMDSGYPKDKIITLGYMSSPPMKFDESMAYFPLENFNPSKHLRLEP